MNTEELVSYLLTPASQIALIIAIAELCKQLGVPSNIIPAIDFILGILSGVLVFGLMLGCGIPEGIIVGMSLGLSACGLFSGIKNTIQSRKESK